MQRILPKNLIILAQNTPVPLYAVGGSVRDFLCGLTPQNGNYDWDICSTLPTEDFVVLAQRYGFTVKAVYKNTGTVKLTDSDNNDYEYSRFRSDKYIRGVHQPVEIFFTDDIALDARRRDFTCNAVYYDIKNAAYLDPLNGIPAIAEKRLTTVAPAQKVFGEDGLRLMRLARQGGQLGFTPDNDCLDGAIKNASLIDDISPERIFAELSAILTADKKYGVADGHYQGLKLLEKTGVLERLIPELTLGKGMAQRADFHKYDILEHSLRAALYANERIRFAALLHDIGKPFCALRDGNSYAHPEEGARLAGEVLTRLKAPKKLITETQTLVKWHMYDFDGNTRENKLRRFFTEHAPILESLLLVKQADFSACTDDLSVAPTCKRWEALLAKMQSEGAPLTLKELAITGKDLLTLGIPPVQITPLLQALLAHAAVNPTDNHKARLLRLAKGLLPKP